MSKCTYDVSGFASYLNKTNFAVSEEPLDTTLTAASCPPAKWLDSDVESMETTSCTGELYWKTMTSYLWLEHLHMYLF